jgi:hypothetical protein
MASLIRRAADQLSGLTPTTLPLSLPIAPITPIAQLIAHLTSNPVHQTYFPYLRFGVLHAIRVTTVWAGLTKSRQGRVGVLHDLFGYLTMACEWC